MVTMIQDRNIEEEKKTGILRSNIVESEISISLYYYRAGVAALQIKLHYTHTKANSRHTNVPSNEG